MYVGLSDLEERLLDAISFDHLPVMNFSAEGPTVIVDSHLEVIHRDGNVVYLGQQHRISFD